MKVSAVMTSRHWLLVIVVLLAGSGLAQEEEIYTNPVIEPVAADPSVIRTPDGTFYLYATQDDWGDGAWRLISIFKSRDLVNWTLVGDVFPRPPAWKEAGGFLWAPDISYYEGVYYLYFAYSLWGDPNPCIGLATAPHPEGPWQDLGTAVFCSEDIGVRNSIDPFVWHDGEKRTMIWGSFHGIYAVELSRDGTKPVGNKTPLADNRFEAPFVHHRDGSYYLFLSSGACCEGENSTYITWVGRSENLLGPYLDALGRDLRFGGGEVVLFRNDRWIGPGHNTVVTDDVGHDWIVYHAIDPLIPRLPNGATRRPVLIDRIDWVDGWPVVNDGEGPSDTPRPAPTLHTP